MKPLETIEIYDAVKTIPLNTRKTDNFLVIIVVAISSVSLGIAKEYFQFCFTSL